jgi:tetratricopeptide (TPR) repeat protein
MTLDQWNEEAKTNIRCLPKYGYAEKTAGQLETDSNFIQKMLHEFPIKKLASDQLIDLGFRYLYHDVKTAMYRFNQAYLLDSTNSDIYWGYGAVYMILQDYPRAKEQYEDGLLHDPMNSRIMTDLGTYFMVQDIPDSALRYFSRSFMLDSTNQNTLFKLSACYYYREDCKNAVHYYEKCKSLGCQPLTKEFVDALEIKCKF